MSNLTSITDATSRTTLFEYDGYGHVTKTTFPDGRIERRTYDRLGRLETVADRNGVVATYSHDWLDRLIGISFSDGTPAVAYEYDRMDRLVTAQSGGETVRRWYDSAGRLEGEFGTGSGSAITYGYDADGRRNSLKLDDEPLLTYGLDTTSRQATMAMGGSTFTLHFDAAWRRAGLSYPNGTSTTYGYDGLSRLQQVLSEHGTGNPLAVTVYGSFDAVDNQTSKSGLDHAESYTYDVLDRLVRVERTGEGAGESFFQYDGIGNRSNASFLPAQPGASAYSYDPNGNLISKVEDGVSWTYEWDALNRLIAVRRDGAEAARFGYDALGRRVSKTVGGLTTRYIYDGEDILEETRSDGTSYTYIHGPGIDEPLARQDGAGARQYYLADGLGSILKMVGPGGETILARRYDAWGNLEAGAEQPGYAYTGREWDPEIGLYYYRARYYDPKVGRFISEDPIGFSGGVNFYAYVGNAPTGATDPSGLLGRRELQWLSWVELWSLAGSCTR